ncbi:MAG: hypothetical protein AAF658_06490, partial [Myxococcota bacterium]
GVSEATPRRYRDPDELPEAWVTALAATNPDRLWVGTCQNGVSLIDGHRSRFVNETSGLPDDRITAVSAGIEGAFVGTLWGLAHVSNQGHVSTYDLGGISPDPRSSALFREGSVLWYGTEAGLVALRIEESSRRIEVAKAMGSNENRD